jgi:predicted amidohydrolase
LPLSNEKKEGRRMRTLIFNANIITGDGETILKDHSLIVENGLISEILSNGYPYYDRSDRTIDACGGFLIPGIINHHTHGITTGPLFDGAAHKPLPLARVQEHLNRHLLEGCTTVVNVDGLANMEEVEEASRLTPINVKTCTTHTSLHLEAAKFLNLGGLTKSHLLDAKDMIQKGAIAVGEAGSSIDTLWYDYLIIPAIVDEKTGVRISTEEAAALRTALGATPPDEMTPAALMTKKGITSAAESLRALVDQSKVYGKLAVEACREGAETAKRLEVPYLLHNAPQTAFLIREFAKDLKTLLIACHSNLFYRPSQAIEIAREVKRQGGWVDIHTGDYFRGQRYFTHHVTTLSLLCEGLVDMISTDIIGFFWDPILRVLEHAVEQNVVSLPQAVGLATGNVLKCLPKVAPNRGLIEEGRVADLTIVDRKRISNVRMVMVGGEAVVIEGKFVRH